MRPDESRNITRFSPSSRMRLGRLSGPGNSLEGSAGTQYSRIRLPIGVPGPTRVTRSLLSGESMGSVSAVSLRQNGISFRL